MDTPRVQVLLVEDNPGDVLLLTQSLKEDPLAAYDLTVATRLDQALDSLHQHPYDILLLDLGLPDNAGLATLTRLRQAVPLLPIIVLSDIRDNGFARAAMQAGAQDYLVKGQRGWIIAASSIRYALERQRAQDELRLREEQLVALVTSLDEVVFEVDEQGICLNVWISGESAVDRPHQPVIGLGFEQIFGSELAPGFVEVLRRVLQNGEPERFEYPVEQDGEAHWHTARFSLIQNPSRDRKTAAVTVRDTTRRRLAEDKLLASERTLKLFVEYAPAAIAMFDREMRYIAASRRYLFDYRIPDVNIIGRLHYEIFPEIPDELKAIHRRCLAGATEMGDETPFARLDGTLDWVKWEMRPWYTPSGEIGGVILFSEVITERKQTEQKLRESEQRNRLLFETMSQGVVYQDANGHLVDANPAAFQMMGTTPEQFRNRYPDQARLHAIYEDGSEFPIDMQPAMVALKTGQPVNNLVMGVFNPELGGYRWVTVNAVPQFQPGQATPYQVYTTFEDITERKQAEQNLLAKLKLQEQLEITAATVPGMLHTFKYGADGRVTIPYASPVIEEMFGLTAEAVAQEAWALFSRVDQQDAVRVFLSTAESAKSLQPWREEFRYHHPQKGLLWIEGHSTPLRNENGDTLWYGILTDITERKRTEALVVAQRDLARAIGNFDTLEAGFRLCLQTALDLSGLDCGGIYLFDLLYQNLDLIYHQGLSEAFVEAVEQFPANTASMQMILPGKPLYFDAASVTRVQVYQIEGLQCLAVIPLLYQGQVIGCWNAASRSLPQISAYSRQVLETLAVEAANFAVHKRAEQALHASEEQYRSLVEAVDALISTVDMHGIIHYQNERTPQATIAGPDEFVGNSLYDIFSVERAGYYLGLVQRVITSNQGLVLESSTGPSWYRTSIQPIRNAQGQAILALVSSTDITPLKTAQQELMDLNRSLEQRVRERTAEVQDLYDNAPAGYHSLDANGAIVRINQTALNMRGYTAAELLGRPFKDFLAGESRNSFDAHFAAFKNSGELKDLEIEVIRKDGSTYPALLSATAIYDEMGNYVSSRSTVVDITARKQAERALLQSRDELSVAYATVEQASQAKNDFLANMSHELRTPLNGILGLSEILLLGTRGELDEYQQKLVRMIDASGRHLLSLINDILDLSKIEAGRLEIHTETIVIAEACQASLAFIKEPAVKKGVGLEFLPDPSIVTLRADPLRLKQILVNLLSNAVKFTPSRGLVTLQVQSDPPRGCISFSVSDTGIGIAEEDLKRLFNPFVQVDNSLTRQHEGTGLGLALVKNLVELHGGSIHVTSAIGQGSCFTVSLPWQLEPAVATDISAASEVASTLRPRPPLKFRSTILLAEDSETNLIMVGDFLDGIGYRMVYARNGLEALARAIEISPDVILMDIQMPELDGLTAIRRLRAMPGFATTPIIALTALAMSGDKERCLAAGASGYISKPVPLKELDDMIRSFLEL